MSSSLQEVHDEMLKVNQLLNDISSRYQQAQTRDECLAIANEFVKFCNDKRRYVIY